jgi:thioredoxin reductase
VKQELSVYDVVIVGGGPAGLSAALALGRARKHVLVCDSGPRRNAAARQMHHFVTRDGTPPGVFRQIARDQLAAYPSVLAREVRVDGIEGARGAFRVHLAGAGSVEARRVLLCTGMIDQLPPLPGFAELWGESIFQCPYCHGFEVQGRAWGYLARPEDAAHLLPFALQARSWTDQLVVFTGGAVEVPEHERAQLAAAGIAVETRPVARLVGREGRLEAAEVGPGVGVRCEVLFAHPPQRQVALVEALRVELDDAGYVRVDPVQGGTSGPGIYAAGDLTTRMQGAVLAAAMGARVAAMLNVELSVERFTAKAG